MFRLRVLGGYALDGDPDGSAPAALKRRAEAVLSVLAVCGELGCTRERLLALLWPESDEAGARHGLRDALHAIRRALGSDAVPSAGRLLRLDSAVVSSDILSFTQALAADRPADAVRSYGGPLLDGFHLDDAAEFERWLDGERARVAREYGEALKRLATAAERAGAWDEAVGWWARAVEHDPVNSHLVLQQVRVLAGTGDRANAIRVAEGHARRLRDEFDLEPDREILATIERIRRGEMPALPAAAPSPANARPVEPSAPAPEPARRPEPMATVVKRVSHWVPWAAAVAALVLGGAFAAARLPSRRTVAAGPRTSIAVLPFRNLGGDSSHAYFADGLHDELMTQLAKVASLRVVGRTSVSGYQETAKPLRQIAEELAVGSIVEAGVQVVGDRLRVTVQLLDPVTERHLWSERYDRTLDDAFAVESDIAQRIVTAVGGTLTRDEAGAIAAAPTPHAGAYDFYLQGLEYQRRPGFLRENLGTALQLYDRAIALDSSFALAHAALASVHLQIYLYCYDRTRSWLDLAGREVEVALKLAPELPQAHLAAALRAHIAGKDEESLAQLELGRRGAPNDAELWLWTGFINRNLGNWDQAIAAMQEARRLDPRNANLPHVIGDTYHYLRHYREAVGWYRRASALAPDLAQPRLSLGWSYFLWQGQLDTLRAVLNSLPMDGDPGEGGGSYGEQRLVLLFWDRKPDSLLSLLRVMRAADAAIDEPRPPALFDQTVTRVGWAAEAHWLRGDSAAARAAFDTAATLLAEAVRGDPTNWLLHSARGMALAALGRRGEAARELAYLEQFEKEHPDRYETGLEYCRARIHARLGETDKALDLIERQLAGPALLSVPELEINPDFDPVRGTERYKALVARYRGQGGAT